MRPFNPRFLPHRENLHYFNLLSNRLATRLNRFPRAPQYPDIREVDDESSSSEEGSSNSDSSSSSSGEEEENHQSGSPSENEGSQILSQES